MKPEERARKGIDELLAQAGWTVQDREDINLSGSVGVAVREFPLPAGFADYLLFVNEEPVGVIEAKKAGQTLIGVEEQSAKYLTNLPDILATERTQLAFSYETMGIETRFTNHLDPEPRSRRIFAFHRPETLAAWFAQAPIGVPNAQNNTMRARLKRMPPLLTMNLRDCQVEAITHLERSFALNKQRALIRGHSTSGSMTCEPIHSHASTSTTSCSATTPITVTSVRRASGSASTPTTTCSNATNSVSTSSGSATTASKTPTIYLRHMC